MLGGRSVPHNTHISKRKSLLPRGKRTQYTLRLHMIFTCQTQAFPPFRKKTCPSGATVQSSPRDLEISFLYQADGRFPGLRFPTLPPSQFLSGCVSAWHHQYAYSDGFAQASHLFPFYPLAKHDRLAEAPAASCYSVIIIIILA